MKLLFAISSSVIGIISFIPYIKDVFKGNTKPHIYSWFIWTLLQTTGAIIMFSENAGIGVLPLITGVVLCVFILFLSFKKGTKNINNFDLICLIGALLTFMYWQVVQNPTVSIILVAFIDFIGFLPTIRKSYEEPHTETPSAYALTSISVLLAISALSEYSFTTVFYLLSLVFTNSFAAAVIFYRRNSLKKKSST